MDCELLEPEGGFPKVYVCVFQKGVAFHNYEMLGMG